MLVKGQRIKANKWRSLISSWFSRRGQGRHPHRAEPMYIGYLQIICIARRVHIFFFSSTWVNQHQRREAFTFTAAMNSVLPSFYYRSLIYSIKQCFEQSNDVISLCQILTLFFIALGHGLLGETIKLWPFKINLLPTQIMHISKYMKYIEPTRQNNYLRALLHRFFLCKTSNLEGNLSN